MIGPSFGPLTLTVLALAGLIVLACIAYGIRELQIATHVLRSRPDSVLDAPNEGPIELRGTVEPVGGALRSPFTDAACVAYEYAVEQERNSKNGSSWVTVASDEEYVPFRLDDESASVLIEPPGADFRLERDARIRVDGGTEPPDAIRRYIERSEDVDSQNRTIDLRVFELRTGTNRRFVERRLDVGERAHVLGTARFDTSVATESGQVNAAVGIDEAALSPSRWIRLRHRLFGYPFVISDRSERRLGVRALALASAAFALAGIVAVATVTWVR